MVKKGALKVHNQSGSKLDFVGKGHNFWANLNKDGSGKMTAKRDFNNMFWSKDFSTKG